MENFKKDFDKVSVNITLKMITLRMMVTGKWMKSMDLGSIDFLMDRRFQGLGRKDGSNSEQWNGLMAQNIMGSSWKINWREMELLNLNMKWLMVDFLKDDCMGKQLEN